MSHFDTPASGPVVLPELEGPLLDAARRRAVPRRRLPRRRLLLAAAAAVVALVAVGLVGGGVFSGGSGPSYAEAAIKVAEANPRLLVTAAGWKVTDAGEFSVETGETTFGDGDRTVTLNWYPANLYRRLLHDRSQVSAPQHSRLLGRTATTVEYGHHGDYATILAPIGGVFVEVRGQLGGRPAYSAVLHSLRPVDVDTWLAAMPAGVVHPGAARARTVGRMLHGIPRPPGFDPGRLEEGTAVLDHYALGVQVAGAVSCGWVENWLAARRSGDPAAERTAVEAMASSHRWPLLLRMQEEGPEVPGSWALNVWHIASQLQAGHLDQGFGQQLVREDGSGYRFGPDWALALGCHGAIRRVPFTGSGPTGSG